MVSKHHRRNQSSPFQYEYGRNGYTVSNLVRDFVIALIVVGAIVVSMAFYFAVTPPVPLPVPTP